MGTELVRVDTLPDDPEWLAQTFSAAELAYCRSMRYPNVHLAARLAAKRAARAALSLDDPHGTLAEAETVRDDAGAPRLVLRGVAHAKAESLGVCRIHLSLTHTRELAAALVVLEAADVNAVARSKDAT